MRSIDQWHKPNNDHVYRLSKMLFGESFIQRLYHYRAIIKWHLGNSVRTKISDSTSCNYEAHGIFPVTAPLAYRKASIWCPHPDWKWWSSVVLFLAPSMNTSWLRRLILDLHFTMGLAHCLWVGTAGTSRMALLTDFFALVSRLSRDIWYSKLSVCIGFGSPNLLWSFVC